MLYGLYNDDKNGVMELLPFAKQPEKFYKFVMITCLV